MTNNIAALSQDARYEELLADLRTVAQEIGWFLEDIEPQRWSQRGRNVGESEWTLHQTVSHLVAVAEYYRFVLIHVKDQKSQIKPVFQRRRDLPAYNQQEIMRRQGRHPQELITALQQALIETAEMARQLTSEQLSWEAMTPVFNRPLTIRELLDTQITHAGVVHGSQIARPAGKAALWHRYEGACQRRMVARFLHLMSLTYWPERGGELRATFQFVIGGASGGEWHIDVSAQGSQTREGRALKPTVTLWCADADALFLLLTGQTRIWQALLRRKVFVWGNVRLATQLGLLFSPT